MSLKDVLSAHDGVAPRQAFLAAGITPYELGRARHDGRIFRVRRAWYAGPTSNPSLVRAVRVGGALTCSSALEGTGMWLIPDARLHVAVPANASRLRSPVSLKTSFADDRADVRLHWRSRSGEVTRARDTVAESLANLAVCQPRAHALVALDSALNLRLVTPDQLADAFRGLPQRCTDLLAEVDGRSQSGLETLARIRLRGRGLAVRIQVVVAGIGRVDVLLGERLILELDGYGFHATGEQFESDRRRDLALQARGYRVLRLSYRQVMFEWDAAERVILAMVRRGDHRWPRTRTLFSG